MTAAIAAGHPLSAEAGANVLRAGGNAVDALLGAALTAFVAEGPLTGPTGGGFVLVREPGGETTLLDCFFAVPTTPLGVMEEVVVDFEDAGTQIFHVGAGSVAVPGLLAGLEDAHRRFATMPWPMLVEPALGLARVGVASDEPRAFLHRILGHILLREEGGRRVYGDAARVETQELCETLELVRDAGAAAAAELLPEFAADLDAYEVVERTLLETTVRGYAVLAPPEPSRGGRIVLDVLDSVATVAQPSLGDVADAIGGAYGDFGRGPLPGTTHVSVVDPAGRVAALSSTLGSGSGIFRRGTQLNNMLGELDVIGRETRPAGTRLPTMLSPTLVLEGERPRLVLGSAGSVRLAGAIAQVVSSVVSGLSVAEAIDAPRIHVDGSTLHVEGGWAEDATLGLDEGWDVVRWSGRNLFFGGVQAVELRADGTLAAAGDPRRGGAGVVVT